MIQKLTKREAVLLRDVDETPVPKLSKLATRTDRPIEYNACIHNANKRIVTRLLDGKEICVINGTNELLKEQIEEKLLQHSAKIVQNPMNTTFCVIVGNKRTVNVLLLWCRTFSKTWSLRNACICEIIIFRYGGKKL